MSKWKRILGIRKEDDLPIRVDKVSDGLYMATLILPDVPNVKEAWSTIEPLDADQLWQELLARGAHQTDIGDAFYEADPNWLSK
jgi:hypothetical protein